MKLNLLIIVPARKGSTNFKNKNIALCNKEPLVNYSFKAANLIKENKKFLFFSNDLKNIIILSKRFFFNEEYILPKKISGKFSRDLDFVNDTLKYLKRKKLLLNMV